MRVRRHKRYKRAMASPKKKKKSGVSVVPAGASAKRVLGSIVIDRFAGQKVPSALKAPLAAFGKAHSALKTATTAVEDAHSERSHAEEQVIGVDKQLNAAVLGLANAIAGANVGTRQNPFAAFSKHTPARLAKLAYARKVKESRALAKKLKPKRVAAAVSAATKTLAQRADAVAKALGAISKPGLVLGKAQRSLQPVVLAWDESFRRLKTLAAAAWIDEEETFTSVFAKPAKVQAPKARKKNAGAIAKGGAGGDAASTKPAPTETPAPTK